MSKVRFPSNILMKVLSVRQLKGALVEDDTGSRFIIDDVYGEIVDLVDERYGCEGVRPYTRTRFDERSFVTIEIDSVNYEHHKSTLDELLARELISQPIRDLVVKLSWTPISPEICPTILSESDLKLCLVWSSFSSWRNTKLSKVSDLEDFMKPSEANRLASARQAEIAAKYYYEKLGCSVADISIGQIGDFEERWRDFDLLVNEHPVDVKNSRRSFTNHDAYVEHTIPRFKTERVSGQEVSIAGVLSEYVSNDMGMDERKPCLILGQANVSDFRKLYSWMRSRFGELLDLRGIWKPKFVAGWAFEYPIEHYPGRNSAISTISETLHQCISDGLKPADIPRWLLTLTDDSTLVQQLGLNETELRLWADLRSLERTVGLSRPSLYCYVIGYMLEGLTARKSPDKVLHLLSNAIFPDGLASGGARPVGLQDSLEYIGNLLRMLSIVFNEILRRKEVFTTFKITHPHILSGMRSDGNWLTLYAYCGGWRRDPVLVKCGASPLYLGRHKNCLACGHLICSECGFCSQACSDSEARGDE